MMLIHMHWLWIVVILLLTAAIGFILGSVFMRRKVLLTLENHQGPSLKGHDVSSTHRAHFEDRGSPP